MPSTSAPGHCCAFVLGARHKRAERVADEAVAELRAVIAAGGAIDAWLADQLLLPLALVPGRSAFSVCHISWHLRTKTALLSCLLPVSVEIEGETEQPGIVRVHGAPAPGH